MKRLFTLVTLFCVAMGFAVAQVPSQSEDVMIQTFYWNSHGETKWSALQNQADEIGTYFTLVWLPPAAAAEGGGSSNMGYHPYNYGNLSSSWGNKAQLTSLISALKAKGAHVIADIVINHHAGNNECCSYPTENFGNYGSSQLDASCICRNDESGKGTGANDAGYGEWQCGASGGYCAARDLDHSNSKVQEHIKKYLKWMKNEIGYDGWRYDLVKGYLGKYTKDYNAAAGAYMSVGEYYDGSYDGCWNWVKETGFTSMVFDFPFHDAMVKWGGGSDFSKLVWKDGSTDRPAGVCHSSSSRKYAVTFIDNHDTDTSHTDGNWPYGGDWLKANAIMLASPGIPCVFWKHWANTVCKAQIKKMIAARRSMGVHSESDVVVNHYSGYYESTATGKKGKLKCFVGSGWSDPSGYTKACSGDGWAYYTTGPVSDPTGGSSQGGGESQGGGTVSSTITVKVDPASAAWSGSMSVHAWVGTDTNITGTWPGQAMTKDSNGWWSYTFTNVTQAINVIFNNGASSSTLQTDNIEGLTADACYKILSTTHKDMWGNSAYDSEEATCPSGGSSQGGGEQGGSSQGGGTQGGGTGSITVGFKAPSSWSSCNAYAWTGDGDTATKLLGSWPGTAVTKSGDFYYATVSASNFNIIFNNGTEQTGDINGITADVCYDGTSLTYAKPWPQPTTTSCTGGSQGGGEQGGGEQGGGEQGGGSDCGSSDHLWYFKGWVNNADIEGIDGDNVFEGGMANFNFTAEKNYVFVIYQVHGVAGVQYMATAGNVVEGVTHATLSPSGSGKFVIPAGTKKVYLYDNGNNTVEISTQPISGKKLIDACATAVAEEKSDASEFAIYPNPVADELNIQSDTEYDSATITNLAGQTMFFTISNNKIAVGSLAKGLYIIDLVRENGTTEKAKFIKK